jgi:hypothetical protein
MAMRAVGVKKMAIQKKKNIGFAMAVVPKMIRDGRGALRLAGNGRAVADSPPLPVILAAAPPRRRSPPPT